jgi:3D-(3,5/4)-trihydroxycyclohexane-1,2-dione acylhydrolase (decyclizing)
MEYGYSAMGYEISGALGVKFAIGDDKEVYSMVGDGSFIMLHSELVTAAQEHKKINVVLFDNASFGCINNLQTGQGNATLCTEMRYRNPETGKLDGKFISVDFAAIARAYGCVGYTIRTQEELEKALIESKEIKDQPVLFDIKVLPKSMTEGYGSWWRVGSVEVGGTEANRAAWQNHLDHVKDARQY